MNARGDVLLQPFPSCAPVESSGVRGGCTPVESSAGTGFAACAGKHYFVIGTRAAFLRTHASTSVPLPQTSGLRLRVRVPGPP